MPDDELFAYIDYCTEEIGLAHVVYGEAERVFEMSMSRTFARNEARSRGLLLENDLRYDEWGLP